MPRTSGLMTAKLCPARRKGRESTACIHRMAANFLLAPLARLQAPAQEVDVSRPVLATPRLIGIKCGRNAAERRAALAARPPVPRGHRDLTY